MIALVERPVAIVVLSTFIFVAAVGLLLLAWQAGRDI